MLPITIPSHFLRILQRKTLQFIWGKTKPRKPKPTLYSPRIHGGLDVPDFTKYYYAAQLSQLPKYHVMTEAPLWVALESVDCDPLSTANLFWLTPTQRWTINYPITKPSLSIWDRLKAWFLVHNLDTIPFFPFLHNPSFLQSLVLPNLLHSLVGSRINMCLPFLQIHNHHTISNPTWNLWSSTLRNLQILSN